MEISISNQRQTLIVGERSFDLKELEDFVLRYYPQFAKRFYLRTVESNGKSLLSFDWQHLMGHIEDGAIIIEDFLKHKNILTNRGRGGATGFVQPSLF